MKVYGGLSESYAHAPSDGAVFRRLAVGVALLLFVTLAGAAPAEAKATPGPRADLDQCANGAVDGPDRACDGDAWVNGNLNHAKAHYREGDSVPYRLRMTGLIAGTPHRVAIEWDTLHNGRHAIDYLTGFDRTETDAVPCSGALACDPSSFATAPIPPQPDVAAANVAQAPGELTLFGGSIDAVGEYVVESTGDRSAQIEISFTPSGPAAVLAWGGHIARAADWGAGNSAGSIAGSPYHMRLVHLDGKRGNQDRSLAASAVVAPGSITIAKDAIPDAPDDFSFTTTGDGLGSFVLDDDADPALPSHITFDDISSFGTKTVTENLVSGWRLEGISCTEDGEQNTTADLASRTATIALDEGEHVSCLFTSRPSTGTLRVVKDVVNDEDGAAAADAFSIHVRRDGADVAGSPAAGSATGTVYLLTAGEYVVSEDVVPAGYSRRGYSGDCSAGGVVEVVGGEERTCVVTNDDSDSVPAITVAKAPDRQTVSEPGGLVRFTVTVANTSGTHDPVTITGLVDDAYGDLLDAANANLEANTCPPLAGTSVASGGSVSCSFDAWVAGNAGDTHRNTVSATVSDDEGTVTTGSGSTDVHVEDIAPAVTLTKTASPTSLPAPGGTATFTVDLANPNPEDIVVTALVDDIYGDLLDPENPLVSDNTCAALLGATIAGEASESCSFGGAVGPAAGIYTDTVTGLVRDDEHSVASASDDARVIVVGAVTCPDSSLPPGSTLAYAIPYGAYGGDATGVTITAELPDGFVFDVAPGAAQAPASGASGGEAVWEVPHVADGDSGSVSLSGTVDPSFPLGDPLTAVITVSADDAGPGSIVHTLLVSLGSSGHTERAFGVMGRLAGVAAGYVPDSDVKNPDVLASVPASPLYRIDALSVAESGETTADASTSTAIATASDVHVGEQGDGWLVSATSVRMITSSYADDGSATSSWAGSVLEGVTINGVPIGTVSHPTSLEIHDEVAGTTTAIKLLEVIGAGAAAGVEQPEDDGLFHSSLTVVGIHVKVTGPDGIEIAETMVAATTSSARFAGTKPCGDASPRVDGRATALRIAGVQDRPAGGAYAIADVAGVRLPLLGGREDAYATDVDADFEGAGILLADSAQAHTEGAADRPSDSGWAQSSAKVEELRLLRYDSGPGDEQYLISADLIESSASAAAGSSPAPSGGHTRLAGLRFGPTDMCSELALDEFCEPAPNTVVTPVPWAVVVLNEQLPGPPASGAASLTVNAVHVYIVGAGNPLGLPAGAEIVIASSHAGARRTVQ